MDHHRRRVRRVGVLLVVTLASLSCCGSGGQAVSRSDGAALSGSRSTGDTAARSMCPDSYRFGLQTTSNVLEDPLYLGDVTACTNWVNSVTYLANGGPGVWTVSLAGDVRFSIHGESLVGSRGSLDRYLFRQAVQPTRSQVLLLPGGSLTIEAPPGAVSLTVDTKLTTAWFASTLVVAEMMKLGPEVEKALAQRGSSLAKSLVTCGLAVYNFTQQHLPDLLASDDPVGQLRAAISTELGATECARSWQLAKEAARQPRIPAWSDALGSLTDGTRFGSQGDDLFSRLKTLPGRFKAGVCALWSNC